MGREREVAMAAVLEAWRSTSAAIASWCMSALWSGLRRRHRRTAYALGDGAGAGGLKLNYDALSYAQNFDDGSRPGECEPDFTARNPAGGGRLGKTKSIASRLVCQRRATRRQIVSSSRQNSTFHCRTGVPPYGSTRSKDLLREPAGKPQELARFIGIQEDTSSNPISLYTLSSWNPIRRAAWIPSSRSAHP